MSGAYAWPRWQTARQPALQHGPPRTTHRAASVDEAWLVESLTMPVEECRALEARLRDEMVPRIEAKGWESPATLGMRARLAALGREALLLEQIKVGPRGGGVKGQQGDP